MWICIGIAVIYGLGCAARLGATRGLKTSTTIGIGFTITMTIVDVSLDTIYVLTEPYASVSIWYVAVAALLLPNLAFFVGSGALRPLLRLPWARYAWHTVMTIRGRKVREGGLAWGRFVEWDQPMTLVAFLV